MVGHIGPFVRYCQAFLLLRVDVTCLGQLRRSGAISNFLLPYPGCAASGASPGDYCIGNGLRPNIGQSDRRNLPRFPGRKAPGGGGPQRHAPLARATATPPRI